MNFSIWLLNKKGNRESTIKRKLRYIRFFSGSLEEITNQILSCAWKDKVKSNALDVVEQYAEFLNLPYQRPNFRAYDNSEMYVPNPEMVKQFLYRVRSVATKAEILLAVETASSSGEVWRLQWKDVNLVTKTVTITGLKGHRTISYPISDELASLLIQLPRTQERIFSHISRPDNMNDTIDDYRKRLAKETGNNDFLKIHFHTFRHYAISWHYFKTKDIVDTQRFARHCNISNTLKYVHIIKTWVKDNQYDVVYAEDKTELTRYLSEGFQLVIKTDWGYCLNRPKSIL